MQRRFDISTTNTSPNTLIAVFNTSKSYNHCHFRSVAHNIFNPDIQAIQLPSHSLERLYSIQFAAMPAHSPYPEDSTNAQRSFYALQHPQQHTQDPEYKASYDDLIDEYATPFAANARHQTYAVETPTDHRRRPSFPMSKQSISSSKLSDETAQDTPSHVSYPPLPPTKDVDTRSIWQKV